DLLRKSLSLTEEMRLEHLNAMFYSDDFKPIVRTGPIIPLVKEALFSGTQGRAACKIEGDEKIEVSADLDMIKTIFANLASNSLEQSRTGDLWIEVIISLDGKKVKVVYSDNGPGIPKEKQEKLFCSDGPVKMSDMVLPTTALMLKVNGGSIIIDQSYTGSGSRFLIDIPRA
ncbi:MAG TPA: ATP-binding protein, partial [Victivallales bacterium]|nr:ATP-binding protein [Victivallales bacterium]